jgi:hypothetical protein
MPHFIHRSEEKVTKTALRAATEKSREPRKKHIFTVKMRRN